MSNLNNPHIPVFVPIDTALFTVSGGAAGWVDTNVSATTGVLTNRIWLISVSCAAGQSAGARAHGSTKAPLSLLNLSATIMAHVDATGHMDLYRAGNDNNYRFLGYLQ